MTQVISTASPREPDNALEALRASLRALRLRHMADDLPELLEEAQREGWGQLELLGELFHRETLRRAQRRFERNLKASGLSEAYALENFDFVVLPFETHDRGAFGAPLDPIDQVRGAARCSPPGPHPIDEPSPVRWAPRVPSLG